MNVLAISAHTDDIELGCGATLARLSSEGYNVKAIAFSDCGNPELKEEMAAACQTLDIDVVSILKYPVRNFHAHRQEILDQMIALRGMVKPDIVFVQSTKDIHQDHQVVTQEAIRAFKHSTIYGYELPWNHRSFDYDVFFQVTERDVRKKIKSIDCYKSQHGRVYFDGHYIEFMARARGLQIGREYAECFEAIRIIC